MPRKPLSVGQFLEQSKPKNTYGSFRNALEGVTLENEIERTIQESLLSFRREEQRRKDLETEEQRILEIVGSSQVETRPEHKNQWIKVASKKRQ